MKMIVDKNTVLLALNTVCKAIRKSVSPVNENVEIQAMQDVVTFTACNDTMRVEYNVPVSILDTDAEVEKTGRILVSAKHFLSVARKMPKGKFLFETNGAGSLKLTSGKTELELIPAEGELLPYNSFSSSVNAYLTSDALYNAFRVKYAASDENIRPALRGVKVEVGPKGLTAVATDSHRLAVTHISQLESEPISNSTSLIPFADDLEVALEILPPDEDIHVQASESAICFSTETVRIYMRLIEQSFPDVSRVIPRQQPSCKVSVDRKELLNSLERASIVSPKPEYQVYLKFEDQEIQLSAKCTDGSMSEVLSATGEGTIDISFNVLFLMDALRTLQSESVVIAFHGPSAPFIIDSASEKHLILPLRNFGA